MLNRCSDLSSAESGPERIAYQARTEQGSSGSPVFVTFGDNQPIIVAIHHKSGDAHDAWNYGTLLWPYIEERYYQKDEPEQLVRTIKNNAGIPVTEVVGQSRLPQWAVRGLPCSCVYGVVSGIAPVSTDSHDVAMLLRL